MPRDSSGTYTATAGQPVVAGTTIDATVFNNLVTDLVAEMTDSLSRSGKGGLTAVLRLVDGLVTGPAFSFTSETGSGWYRAGAGDVRLAILGTARLTVTASGLTITGTLDSATIDRAGTISLGTTNGTTVTIGRAGQTTVVASTLDVASIDRAGTISIGGTSGTTITLGRSGQTVTLPGTADITLLDRAGTIGIGTTSGTTLTLGRSGQTQALAGNVTVAGTLGVTGETSGPYTWRRVIATGDTSNNAIAAGTDVAGLSFAASSGKNYLIRATLFLTTAASTTGAGVSLKSTGAPTTSTLRYIHQQAGSTSAVRYAAFADSPTALADSNTTLEFESLDGYLVTTGAGTIQLRLITEVDTSAVTVKAGSYLEWMEFT